MGHHHMIHHGHVGHHTQAGHRVGHHVGHHAQAVHHHHAHARHHHRQGHQTHHHKHGSNPQIPVIFPVTLTTFARRRSHARSSINKVRIVKQPEREMTTLEEARPVLQSLMSVLGVETVHMNDVQENLDANFFDVEAILCNGRSSIVSRRYSDFLTLHRSLNEGTLVHITDFPPKHLFRCRGRKLAERKQRLSLWLHDVLQSPAHILENPAHPSSQKLLAVFLGLTQDSEEGLHVPINHIPLSPPSAPAQDLPASEGMELQVEVPVGVSAGQHLEFCIPDGTKLTVAVPEGVAGGSMLHLWYDNNAGILRSLPKGVDQEGVDQEISRMEVFQTGSGMLLEITIPQGFASGERVAITVPDGRVIAINAPIDAKEGSVLRLWFEQVPGSLTVLGSSQTKR